MFWSLDFNVYFFDSSLWNWEASALQAQSRLNPPGFLLYSGHEDTIYGRNWKPPVETYTYTKVESVTKWTLDAYLFRTYYTKNYTFGGGQGWLMT